MPDAQRGHGCVRAVGWRFVAVYALAYMSTCLLLLAPLLVTPGTQGQLPRRDRPGTSSLALVTGVGACWRSSPTRSSGDSATAPRRRWACGDRGWSPASSGALSASSRRAGADSIPVVLLGWCLAQLFFNAPASRHGRRAAGPGPHRSARCRLRGPRRVPADRVGGRHVPRRALRRNQLAMFLAPCAIGGSSSAVRRQARRPPPGRGAQTAWSMREFAEHVLRQPASQPRLRVGVRQPLPLRPGLRLPRHVPGLLPARPVGSAEDEVPHQIFLGTLAQSAVLVAASLVGGQALGPGRAPQGLRPRGSSSTGWPCSGSPGQRLQRLPGRHGHRRPRVRDVHGRRPRPGRRRAARPGHRRQGPRRVQHGRSPPFSVAPALAPASWPSAAAATACCTASPASAPCSRPRRSCPSRASAEPTTPADTGGSQRPGRLR